jgi:hypothetical protein
MNFIFNHSQYKHEYDIEQQQKDIQIYSSSKIYDRHTDNSLLGSVRRRFIPPKLRTSSPSSTIIISTPSSNNTNDSKSKRSMTMDLRRSTSKESMTNNGNHSGKMISIFSLSKVIL